MVVLRRTVNLSHMHALALTSLKSKGINVSKHRRSVVAQKLRVFKSVINVLKTRSDAR